MGLKGAIYSNTVAVENFNTLPSEMDRSNRENLNNDATELIYTMNQMDLTDIYKTFHSTNEDNTLYQIYGPQKKQ